MLDLHSHSSYSDGSDTPAQLVVAACAAHLRALALTDHDSGAGTAEFLDECRKSNLTGIAGIELSADPCGPGQLHLLGLGIDPASDVLEKGLEPVLEGRHERNERILEKLRDLGFNLTWEEVTELAGEDIVGRPHFAQAMVARGWAETVPEVFENYLGKGAPAYVDRFRLSPAEAIGLIKAAGGVAVLAHPLSWYADFAELREELKPLVDCGLRGIEAYHPSAGPEENLEYLRIAKYFGLLVTGGSDYHGAEVKQGIKLGTGNGSLFVPDKLLQPLLAEVCEAGYVLQEA